MILRNISHLLFGVIITQYAITFHLFMGNYVENVYVVYTNLSVNFAKPMYFLHLTWVHGRQQVNSFVH